MQGSEEKREKEDQPSEFQVVDRRHFTDLESLPLEAPAEEKPRYPTYVEELMAKLKTMEDRFEEKKRQIDEEISRTRARLEADANRRIEAEKQKIVLPFLEVLDNLERAMEAHSTGGDAQHLLEGIRMTADLFRTKLKNLGVEAVPVLNQPFDPNLGQAISMVEVDDESQDGIVVDEILRGYRMGDQLLRPAQVRVGQHQRES